MKITPIAQGQAPGVDIGAASTQRTSPDRIEAAKAVARGENPMRLTKPEEEDPQVSRLREPKKLKMKTNFSTNREESFVEPEAPEAEQPRTIDENVDTLSPEAEATKPLSPQFAALARQKRALQVKERELAAKEEALKTGSPTDGRAQFLAEFKAKPIEFMSEAGLIGDSAFYDAFTQHLVNGPPVDAAAQAKIQALEAKLDALEKGVDTKLQDRDTQAEESHLTNALYEAETLAKEGDTYEAIRKQNAYGRVLKLIYQTYKQKGQILEVSEAMNQVEEELLKEADSFTSISKVRNRLQPAEQVSTQNRPQQMRTLTNRDNARPQMSRRERAIAAMNGTLKR